MNGSYFQNPTFPQAGMNQDTMGMVKTPITPPGNISAQSVPLTLEQSLIENILRLNKGKRVKVYATYPDAGEWRDKVYDGIIEEAGRDHLILMDPNTGHWFLIKAIYIDYVEFAEKINYNTDYSDTFD